MQPTFLFVAFLLAHAAIHAGFLAPAPRTATDGPTWPFALDRSWLLGRSGIDATTARAFAATLVAVTLGGFGLAAVATLGWLPVELWTASLTIGAVGSLALLTVFFHPWLVLGVAIDLVLIGLVLLAGWTPGELPGTLA